MSTVTDTEIDPMAGLAEGEDHASAASKFFNNASPDKLVEKVDKPADKPADKTPPAKTPTKPADDPLASIVKLPGKEAPQETKAELPADLTKDIDDLKDPDEKSKGATDWKTLKTISKEARTKAYQLEQQLATATKAMEELKKTAPVDEATKARIGDLETQNKVLSERLKVLDLRSHPEFEQKFLRPLKSAKQAITALFKTEEIDADIEEMLSLKGRKFNEAASEILERLTPIARVKFQKSLDQIIEAQTGADDALQQADEFLKTAHTTNGARSRAAFDQVGAQFQGLFVPAVVDEKADDAAKASAAEYNAALANVGKQAEQLAFGQIDERGAASMAHRAALFDFVIEKGIPRIGTIYQNAMKQLVEKIQLQEQQIAELTAASPKAPGGAGSGVSTADDKPADEDHLSAARRYF